MSKYHILIGSKRVPKVNGVKNALLKLSTHFNFNFDDLLIKTLDSQSDVSDTPTSIDEIQTGAKNRAVNIFKNNLESTTISIGVEGGIYVVNNRAFLQSWCAVYDGSNLFYGSSGAIEIPTELKNKIILEKQDLGKVIDEYAGKKNIRSNEGTWGILSNNIITREESFTLAATISLISYFRTQNENSISYKII